MTILDAQSKDVQRARVAVIGLLAREGVHIKAFHGKSQRRGWVDFHLIINGQRHEANQNVLKGIAECGKATIKNNRKNGFICVYATDLVIKGKNYSNESH